MQSELHPLVGERPFTLERHCLSVMHLKAYETAAERAAGRDVLDVGCNHGYGTALIAEKARSVVGVDVSELAVETARLRHPGLMFQLVSGAALPFPDASFDVVVFFQLIEHLDDPAVFLRDVARVLRPGGLAILTTPNRLTRIEPGGVPWNRFHVREYSASELRDVLAAAFPHVVVRGLHGPARFHEIELGRVAYARRARALRRGGPVRRLQGRVERRLRRAKMVLLERLLGIAFFDRMQRRRLAPFTTAVLSYGESGLETALDLMAICRKR